MNEEQRRRQLALELAIRMAERSAEAQTIEDAAKALLTVAQQVDDYLLGKGTETRKS